MRPIELGEGRAVFEGEPGEEHYNPIGVVHGGYAATLLDSALGCAVHTTLPAGVGYTSLGLEAKYVRPITRDTGRVLCEAQRPLPRPQPGDREANADGGRERQAARPRGRHLHDPRRLSALFRRPMRRGGGRRRCWFVVARRIASITLATAVQTPSRRKPKNTRWSYRDDADHDRRTTTSTAAGDRCFDLRPRRQAGTHRPRRRR
jgi:uncharacterized protein (TIGR00369 family)